MSDLQKAEKQMRNAINNLNALVREDDEHGRKVIKHAVEREKLSIDSDKAIIETAKGLQAMLEITERDIKNRSLVNKRNSRFTWIVITIAALTLIATIIGILVKVS